MVHVLHLSWFLLGAQSSFSVGWIVTLWITFLHFFFHHILWCPHLYQQYIHLQPRLKMPPTHRYNLTLVYTFAVQISVNTFYFNIFTIF